MQGDVFGDQNTDAEDDERNRVSGTPGCADPDALPDVALFPDDVCDGYDVVSVGGVFESEQKAEC